MSFVVHDVTLVYCTTYWHVHVIHAEKHFMCKCSHASSVGRNSIEVDTIAHAHGIEKAPAHDVSTPAPQPHGIVELTAHDEI